MNLYHTGFSVINNPDIHYGRKNADFGQGFYMSDDEEFSRRWAKERRGSITYINKYELDFDGLIVKQFERNEEWFDYIFANRAGYDDKLKAYDVIIGPIANDTIYNTFGVITSGLISRDKSLKLLLEGPEYRQIVIKSERAAKALKFISSEEIPVTSIREYRKTVSEEERAYQEKIAPILSL